MATHKDAVKVPPAAPHKFLLLPEAGHKGNSHMLMMDKNNLQIADLIIGWIGESVATRSKSTRTSNRVIPLDIGLSGPEGGCCTRRPPLVFALSPRIHTRRPTGCLHPLRPRRGGRVVDRTALEMRHTGNRIGGSDPHPLRQIWSLISLKFLAIL